MPGAQQPTDWRQRRQRMEQRLLLTAVALFLCVGGVLIGLLYGWKAVLTGMLCLVPGVLALVLLWLLLGLLERLKDRWE
ncbi:MAG TPA: hypothetical protein ENL34_02065 [Chloroflexi bacterium]|nr:hypothetical protein [Chloroflexota bacterium]